MSLWKSPILYVGIILVLAVTAALAAPFVVDWNSYRAGIEDYGRRLTGRTVRVEGPIAVRLFPWPQLALKDVSVANPPGAADPNLMEAESLVVRMTLGGLLNGAIEVERVDVVKPIFSFERLATGQGTWRIAPAADLAKSRLLDHVRLDQIHVFDGTVRLADRRRGGVAVIEHIGGMLSAPSITGPWRARLQANYAGSDLAAAVTTGQWRPDAPLKFGFSLSPPSGSGFNYGFDGQSDGQRITGVLRAEPQPEAEGKADAVPSWRSLVMTAKVTSDFDRILLEDIDIAARKAEDGGRLVSGSAEITLGPTIGVDARIAAPRFDLDGFSGDASGAFLRSSDGPVALATFLDALPAGIDGKLAVKIGALDVLGSTLENAEFEAAMAEGALRIKKLHAKLPGQSEALFQGVFLADPAAPQLAGDLALETPNLRELVRWMAPEAREGIAEYWKGSRGRLKLETRLDLSPGRLRVSGADFELDGAQGSASFSLAAGPHPAAELDLAIARADIDSFTRDNPAAAGWIAAAAEHAISGAGGTALKIKVKAGELRLNGVEAGDAALEAAVNDEGLRITRLAARNVQGASFDVSGNVQRGTEGFEGLLQATATAGDPRGLLQLIGLIPPDREPAWTAALGKTALAVDAEFKPKDAQPAASFHIRGSSGALGVDGNIAVARSLDWRTAEIAGVVELSSPRSTALLALLGLRPAADPQQEGRAAIVLTGSMAQELRVAIDAEILGATAKLESRTVAAEPGMRTSGTASLTATDASNVWTAAGCGACGGAFEIEADFEADAAGLRIARLAGKTDGDEFRGQLTIGSDLAVRGEVSMGDLALRDLLALTFLRWDGGAPSIETPLSATPPFGLSGELWLRPARLHLFDGLTIGESQVGLISGPAETRLAVFGKASDGQLASFELGAKPNGTGVALDGRLSVAIDLVRELKSAGGSIAAGTMRIEGEFAGSGNSAAAALAGLKGAGSYQLKAAHLVALDPKAFVAAALKAESGPELERALKMLFTGSGVTIADRSGTFEAKDGSVSFLPINVREEEATIVVEPTADLPSAALSIGLAISFDGAAGLPPLAAAYTGAPGNLVRTIDAGKTMSELGLRILRKGVDELERLQREQERIAAEEERQRKIDADRVAAWQAHREELARRVTEMRVHAEQYARKAEQAAEERKRLERAAEEMNRSELDRRVRELRMRRNTMRLKEAASLGEEEEEPPLFGSETQTPVPRPRQKPRLRAEVAPAQSEPGLPLVLVPPDPLFHPQPPKKRALPHEMNR